MALHVRGKNENTWLKQILILVCVAFFPPSFAVVSYTGKKRDIKTLFFILENAS